MDVDLSVLENASRFVLRASLQACVIIAVIRLVQIVLRTRLAPRWHYALWLILVLRLAVPWSPSSAVSIFNWIPLEPSATFVVPPDTANPISPRSISDEILPVVGFPVDGLEISANADALKTAPSVWTWSMVAAAIWLAGVVLLLAYVAVENAVLWRLINRSPAIVDPRALQVLETCRARLDLRRNLPTAVIAGNVGPALFGFLRPRLLVPEGLVESLPPERLRHIFLHELGHYKRRDILVNWLMTLLVALHWPNPFMWYAFSRMRADRELACDALALSHTDANESREYGMTIVELLQRKTLFRHLPGTVGILEEHSHLKRRIAAIVLFRKNSYRWTALAAVVLLGSAGILLTDAQARETEQDDSEAVSESDAPVDPATDRVPNESFFVIDAERPAVEDEGAEIATEEIRALDIPQLPATAQATGEPFKIPVTPRALLELIAPTLTSPPEIIFAPVIRTTEVLKYALAASTEPETKQASKDPSIDEILEVTISMVFEDIHISAILDFMMATYSINIMLDSRVVPPPTPSKIGIVTPQDRSAYVTDGIVPYVNLKNVTMSTALGAVLRSLNLDYVVEKGYLWISSGSLLTQRLSPSATPAFPASVLATNGPAYSSSENPMFPLRARDPEQETKAAVAERDAAAQNRQSTLKAQEEQRRQKRSENVERLLGTKVSALVFEETYFPDFAYAISKNYGLTLQWDNDMVPPRPKAGEDPTSIVKFPIGNGPGYIEKVYPFDGMVPSVNLKNVTLGEALETILAPLPLTVARNKDGSVLPGSRKGSIRIETLADAAARKTWE